MFTGIVEEIGEVTELNTADATGGTSLTVTIPSSSALLLDAHQGDSIAVNGVCLTIVAYTQSSFTVGIAPETLRLTNLASLTQSSRVNLERAVRADTRMGGHFMQGHVDCTASIMDIRPDGNALTIKFSPTCPGEQGGPSAGVDIMRHVVRKGYVALDGISLTITKVDDVDRWWEVMLVVYTQERVTLACKNVGDLVNVEVDVMAKYAEKSLAGYLDGNARHESMPPLEKLVEKLVIERLAEKSV